MIGENEAVCMCLRSTQFVLSALVMFHYDRVFDVSVAAREARIYFMFKSLKGALHTRS